MNNFFDKMSWKQQVINDLHQFPVKDYGKVCVLMGGYSKEREISLMSGNSILKALQSKDIDAHAFDPKKRSIIDLAYQNFKMVFIALHGQYGEDGSIQGVLEYFKIPYTGSGMIACALSIDKQITKRIWSSLDLPIPDFQILTCNSNWNKVVKELGLPLMVKTTREGSSLGVFKIEYEQDLKEAFFQASKFNQTVFAEKYISGKEVTCSIVNNGSNSKMLPIIQIEAKGSKYDYHNKYFSDTTNYFCPAKISPSLVQKIQNYVIQAYTGLNCESWARIDVMIDEENEPYLLEINTVPGMTNHSLFPMSAAKAGVNYQDLVLWILSKASLKQ